MRARSARPGRSDAQRRRLDTAAEKAGPTDRVRDPVRCPLGSRRRRRAAGRPVYRCKMRDAVTARSISARDRGSRGSRAASCLQSARAAASERPQLYQGVCEREDVQQEADQRRRRRPARKAADAPPPQSLQQPVDGQWSAFTGIHHARSADRMRPAAASACHWSRKSKTAASSSGSTRGESIGAAAAGAQVPTITSSALVTSRFQGLSPGACATDCA